MIPDIKRMVVLPNHINQFANDRIPLDQPVLSVKKMVFPVSASKIWLIGPLFPKSMRKSIPKAAAMTRFGMYMMALKKPEHLTLSLESVNQIAKSKEIIICGMKQQIQIIKVLPQYFQKLISVKRVAKLPIPMKFGPTC